MLVVIVRQFDSNEQQAFIQVACNCRRPFVPALLDKIERSEFQLGLDLLLPTGVVSNIGVALVTLPSQNRNNDLLVDLSITGRLCFH